MHTRSVIARVAGVIALCSGCIAPMPAIADAAPQALPFAQPWTNPALITVDDDWSAVPGVIGYRGDGLTSAIGADPGAITAPGDATPIDVLANRPNPNTLTNGGVAEFDALSDPTIALQGSGAADAPHLVLHVNTSGRQAVQVSYALRDVDGSGDDAVQPVAVQYRVGASGAFTNLPAGFVADATSGPNLATLVTPISVTLPAACDNQPLVQVRIITTNAAGDDEWVGVDDITVTGSPLTPGPDLAVAKAGPAIAQAGALITYTVGATNTGTALAPGVVLTDVLPAGFAYVADTSGLPPALGGGAVAWSLGDLAPGAGRAFQVALAAAPSTGAYTNTATAAMAAADVWPGNDTAVAVTQLTPAGGALRIRDIQGAAHLSPYNGTLVAGVPGIVTARRPQSFVMQDPAPDANPATSEGILVFTGGAPTVNVGDAVVVTGTVAEFRPGGVSGDANLTITQIGSPIVTRLSSGNALPAPVVIGQGGRVPPGAVIDDDAAGSVEVSGSFDAATDGIDFYESLEGMLVQVNNAVASGPTSGFGETPVLADGGAGAAARTARGGVVIAPGDFNPERVIVDDALIGAAMPAMNVGDRATAPITGVVDYSFGNFKLLAAAPFAVAPGGLAPEVAAALLPHELAVASMNVENLSAQDPITKFARLAAIVVDHLRAPDVIALEEMQDNSGPTDDGTVSASLTFTKLIDAIAAAGGPAYDYRQIDPANNQDGGQPGGNIRVGFLFRADRGVSFVDRPGATATAANAVINDPAGPRLLFSPGRIDPNNSAFSASRKPLAAEFRFRGAPVFVIANHWNSKGGDQPLFGRYQPPVLESEAQRLLQAAAVKAFVAQILAADPGARVIVLGDLNDFEFSAPLAVLASAGLTTLIEHLPQGERYTYVYEGNSQALDHTLVSPGLMDGHAPVLDIVHVNAEFVDQASDHDPQVARLAFGSRAYLPIAFGGR